MEKRWKGLRPEWNGMEESPFERVRRGGRAAHRGRRKAEPLLYVTSLSGKADLFSLESLRQSVFWCLLTGGAAFAHSTQRQNPGQETTTTRARCWIISSDGILVLWL